VAEHKSQPVTDISRSALRLGIMSSALPGWNPGDLCAAAADAGVDGIEWGVGHGQAIAPGAPGTDVARLADASHARGLTCAGLAVQDADGLRYPLETWRRLAERGQELGAPHVRVFASAVDPANVGAGFEEVRSRLAACAAVVAEAGLRLLLEPSPRTLTPGPALACQALAAIDPETVGVVYDPGSMAQEGWLDPRLALAVYGPLLRHVHVKNVTPGHVADSWGWRPATLEQGFVNWTSVFEALDAVAYDGWLVVDHLSGRADAEVLAGDVAGVRRLIEAVVTP
jgi:sugar phosphate isomerase/epimerase